MQKNNRIHGLVVALFIALVGTVWGGMPLNSLDGHGGYAFNPLAYTGGHKFDGLPEWITLPQVGGWYIRLHGGDIEWQSYSLSLTLLDRLELSYAVNRLNARKYGDSHIFTSSGGVKLRLLDENLGDHAWVPAIAIGAVYRHTDFNKADRLGLDKNGFEYYVVATKLITQTPLAVMLSAGLQISNEVAYGMIGHNDYDMGFFANVDVFPVQNVAIGAEFRQGINAGKTKTDDDDRRNLKNAHFWNGHLTLFINEQLTLMAAYVYTGDWDKNLDKKPGFGHGVVVSGHYQF